LSSFPTVLKKVVSVFVRFRAMSKHKSRFLFSNESFDETKMRTKY
jgi:hypothetical protein